MNLTKNERRRWRNKGAVLMVRRGDFEQSTYAPPSFYEWTVRSRRIYMNKHFPRWTAVCNGIPWDHSGSHSFRRCDVEET